MSGFPCCGGSDEHPPEHTQDCSTREPKTMARVQGTVEGRWPKRRYNVWITRENGGVQRHVSVKFGREWIEGVAATWLDAMAEVDARRASPSSGDPKEGGGSQ